MPVTPTPPDSGKTIRLRCPGCGEPTVYATSNPHRPFCSARCQGHDFGAWASENYRVAADPNPEDKDD